MLTKTIKWIAMSTLFLAVLGLSFGSYQLILEATLFLAIFVLTNKMFLWLNVVCLAMSLVSLAVLKTRPRLAMPSITNRIPGRETL